MLSSAGVVTSPLSTGWRGGKGVRGRLGSILALTYQTDAFGPSCLRMVARLSALQLRNQQICRCRDLERQLSIILPSSAVFPLRRELPENGVRHHGPVPPMAVLVFAAG